MYITFEKVSDDLKHIKILIKKYDYKLYQAKYNHSKANKFLKWFYQMDINDYYAYLKRYISRERLLTILKSFPDLINKISLIDYKDDTKLNLILHQHNCIQRFSQINEKFEKLYKDIENIKIQIN